jgi:hypothetical protein
MVPLGFDADALAADALRPTTDIASTTPMDANFRNLAVCFIFASPEGLI